jgi:DcuC family C4-dicarboxylate transporter
VERVAGQPSSTYFGDSHGFIAFMKLRFGEKEGNPMSPALAICLTIILLAGFVFALVKDLKPIIILLLLSLVGCLVFAAITGQSVVGKATTGNIFIDCFELFATTMKSQMSGALLTILAVLGYVGYMNHLGASDRFALICAKPFMKLKNPSILCSGVILLVFFLKLAIPSATSLAALMLATMYPVLRKSGVGAMTSASCIMIATGFIWGPADTMSAQIFTVAGSEFTMTVPEFFAAYHIPTMCVMLPFALIAFPIYSAICDKRAAAKAAANGTEVAVGNIGTDKVVEVKCPAYYALLPILPLVIVLIFSKIGIGTIVISVIGAVFMSLIISMIVDLAHEKNFSKILDDANEFFTAMANFLAHGGWLIIPAAMFATTLNSIGGLQAIANLLAGAGGNGVVITIVGCILCMPIIICTGSVTATLAIAAPLMVSISAATGMDPYLCFMAVLVTLGVSSCMCPVHPQTIMVSTTAGVDIMQLIKRNAPIACMVIAAGWVGCFVFAG